MVAVHYSIYSAGRDCVKVRAYFGVKVYHILCIVQKSGKRRNQGPRDNVS